MVMSGSRWDLTCSRCTRAIRAGRASGSVSNLRQRSSIARPRRFSRELLWYRGDPALLQPAANARVRGEYAERDRDDEAAGGWQRPYTRAPARRYEGGEYSDAERGLRPEQAVGFDPADAAIAPILRCPAGTAANREAQ